MKNVKVIFGLLCFFQLSLAVAGVKPFQIGSIDYAGSGCTPGSLSIENTSETNIQITHFDFKAQAGERKIVRSNCSVRIPVTVEPGYQVALQAVNNGQVSMHTGSRATISRELFVAGSISKPKSFTFVGDDRDRRFTLKKSSSSELVFSPCGESPILAMNTSATLIAANSEDSISVDNTRLIVVVRVCR